MGDIKKSESRLDIPTFHANNLNEEQPHPRERKTPGNIAEGQSVSSPMQFVSGDAADVFCPMWFDYFCGFNPA